jgi:hypothetical protein
LTHINNLNKTTTPGPKFDCTFQPTAYQSISHKIAIMAQDPRALLQKVGFYPSTPLPDELSLTTSKADKAASGAGGGFSLFGGRQEKWENAADLYTQAANAFRMQKQSIPTVGIYHSEI